MAEVIAVMGGSFNPPTIAHLRVMQAAIKSLNAIKGIFCSCKSCIFEMKDDEKRTAVSDYQKTHADGC